MKINQVNFSFVPMEDRLLFKFNTLNKNEFRMWLTRAMSIKLLIQLNCAAKINILREQTVFGTVNMEAIGEFRREAVLAKADFVQSFSSEAEIFPLGLQPILVTDIIMDSSKSVSVVTFCLAAAREVNLSLNQDLGVAIGKLLSDVLDGLDWGLGITKELPGVGLGGLGEKRMLH